MWTGNDIEGWSFFVVKEKLKKLKEALKVWNRSSFGEIGNKIHELQKELQDKDKEDEQSCLGESDIIRRNEIQAQLSLQLKNKQMVLQQKAKLKWLKEGDINSGFFHRAIRGRRLKNDIGELFFDNTWISKPVEVKARVRNHFKNFFKRKERQMPDLPLDFMRRKLSNEERQWLIRDFDFDEIKEAVWSCCGDKSPGPDGFNFTFWRAAWHIVKEDLLQVLKEFHASGKIPKGGNVSFIVLIPKKEGAGTLDEFRPILLITSLYKIIAKILAGRLKKVIGSVISDNQSAFIKTRFILDGARKWILGSLESATASVLVNGSSTGDFKLERGLRQGDPLSPFLFLIVAEGLHEFIERAVERQLLFPVKIGKDKVSISHLQYADDTIFLFEAYDRNVECVKKLLILFQFVSGLAVNFEKSSLLTVGVDETVERRWASLLLCKIGSFPCKYLGTKVGGRSNGGLGFRNLEWVNQMLLIKWLWRFLRDGEALWARVVKSIYGELVWGEQGECSVAGRGGQKGWWRKIVERGGGRGDCWFIKNLRRRLGDGLNIFFWEDVWAANKPLKFVFPRLYNLCLNKKSLAGESGFWEGESWLWAVEWRRELREREKRQVDELLSVVADFAPCTGSTDGWRWKATPEGFFTTKSAYDLLAATREEQQVQPLEMVKVWEAPTPHKAMRGDDGTSVPPLSESSGGLGPDFSMA
ncbi:uncharacterized protein LOC131007971 [Salvia miltiorrhiza]|uniref:uncharacterized protein LOC131007971 n=1 Tax=Salvia miltiorrhiza TaxID=226208 RepID=UPI0025AB92BC|nr:uncharacterized protein LOC131007971 [Salvia miltiorrhiza]